MISEISPSVPESILLALDGSVASDLAAPFARDLATRGGLPVTILHVFPTMKQLSTAAESEVEWTENAEPRAVITPPKFLRESVALLRDSGIDVTCVGRIGDIAEQIRRELDAMANPWVVVSTLGMSGFRKLFLGSTALDLVRSFKHPVMLIPSTKTTKVGFDEHIGCIATFLDGTPEAEYALRVSCGASKLLEAEIELVKVAETMDDDRAEEPTPDDYWGKSLREEAERYLRAVQQGCDMAGVQGRPVTLAGTAPVQIARYVRERQPDLAVMATRRRSSLERWTYGSLAEKIADALPIPMLLVPVDPKDAPKPVLG